MSKAIIGFSRIDKGQVPSQSAGLPNSGGTSVDTKPAILTLIIGVFTKVLILLFLFALLVGAYTIGVINGYKAAGKDAEEAISSLISKYESLLSKENEGVSPTPTPTSPQPRVTKVPTQRVRQSVNWGGPELWEAVNKARVESGVNPLSSRSELCTIASIRLNELLELGKLDGHEGFGNLRERRPDLAWIFDKYSTIAEFLAMGGETPQDTVSMWKNTLGHSQLLKGGEYVWGCIYAQNTFAVAIVAF
jgi:uncharacterized protein YkwD